MSEYKAMALRCYWCNAHKPLYVVPEDIENGDYHGADQGLCKNCAKQYMEDE